MDSEKLMEFILEQQEKFASDIQVITQVMDMQQDHFGRVSLAHQAQFNQVSGALLDMANSQARTTELMGMLAERVLALSDLLERHIASHIN
jgi:hypothetical protein